MGDKGVSNVIGAILVLAIVAAAFAAARVTVLPALERDREIERIATLEERLAKLAASARTTDPAQGAQAFLIPVGRGDEFLGTSGLPPTVSFEATGPALTVSSPRMRIWSDGASAAGASESWSPLTSRINITNLAAVDDLRLKITSTLSQANHLDAVDLTLRNRTGAFAGDFRFRVSAPGGSQASELTAAVRTESGTTIFFQGIHSMTSPIAPPFWVDVLTPTWRFDRVIADAEKPVSLSIETFNAQPLSSFITAEYAMRSREAAPDGTLVTTGGGTVREPYAWRSAGGALSIAAANNRYPDQKLVVEHGALLLDQGGAFVFRVPPDFGVARINDVTVVSLDGARLQGATLQATSTGAAVATLTPTKILRVEGRAPEATLVIETRAPAAWAGIVHDAFGRAGLVSPKDYMVTTGSASIQVRILGTSPSSASEDVHVAIKEVSLDVAIVA
ncbi:MAG TPA: hypothetical protein VM889_03835 [Candidatus Thermoplasmatota archaeon]|nr:hypothetical protein [Candidatus Thermoplasmatota archaeon]